MIGMCCLCGAPLDFWGLNKEAPYAYGNNPDPLGESEEDRCCDACNQTKVIPARLEAMRPYRYGQGPKAQH